MSTNVTGCVSYWVAEEMASNNVWGQVGYFLCDTNGITPTAFYQIWNNGGVAAGGSTSVTPGLHQFSMYLTSGTTWAYAVDGAPFGTVVMNSTTSSSTYPIEALSEENYISNPYNLPQVQFSSIQALESVNWYSPINGFEPYGCGSTGKSCWGVAGNLQNSTIPADGIVVGGNIPLVNAGSFLWNVGSTDFAIVANPGILTTDAGIATKSTIDVTPVNGFSGTVSLVLNTNSTALVCTLSPSAITGGSGSSQLSCRGTVGNYLATVAATSGALSHTTTVIYRIQDYSITAQPASILARPNSTGTSTIVIASLNGFIGTVNLTVITNSTNLTCNLSSTRIAGGSGDSIMTCTGGVVGTYLATVTAGNGTMSHDVLITYQITNLAGSIPATPTSLFEFATALLAFVLALALVLKLHKKRKSPSLAALI